MSASHIESLDLVVKWNSIVDRDAMRHSITSIEDQSSCFTFGHQRAESLDLEHHSSEAKLLKQDFCHFSSILHRVSSCFSDKDFMASEILR
jgi:hypothetical protein